MKNMKLAEFMEHHDWQAFFKPRARKTCVECGGNPYRSSSFAEHLRTAKHKESVKKYQEKKAKEIEKLDQQKAALEAKAKAKGRHKRQK